jgi:hypothetical protein
VREREREKSTLLLSLSRVRPNSNNLLYRIAKLLRAWHYVFIIWHYELMMNVQSGMPFKIFVLFLI